MRRTSSGRCCAHLQLESNRVDTDLWAEPIRCRNANRAAALSETARRIRGFLPRRLSYGPIGASLKISLDYLKTAGFPAGSRTSVILPSRPSRFGSTNLLQYCRREDTHFLQACTALGDQHRSRSARVEWKCMQASWTWLSWKATFLPLGTPLLENVTNHARAYSRVSAACGYLPGRRRHRLFIMLAFNYPSSCQTLQCWSTLVRLRARVNQRACNLHGMNHMMSLHAISFHQTKQ